MVNRTSKPLTFQHYQSYIDVNLQTKALRRAYLGDETGVIEVQSNGNANDHYGKVYIRFPVDTDDNGATVLGQAVEAYVNPNCNYTHKSNLPVLVRTIGSNSGYMVEQVDPIASNRVGYNTHVLNPLHPTHSQIWLRQIRDARVFATATDNTDSTTVSIEPFLYHYDGTLYDGGEPNNIQLSSYMPTNGTETLVAIGKRANNNTVQVISGASRNITPVKYSLSDINLLVDDFDDYVMPIQAVKLADGAVTVLERDIHQDLRQFINVQQPRGFPNPVTRHRYIAVGYQEQVHGKLYVTTGKVHIDGKLVLVGESSGSAGLGGSTGATDNALLRADGTGGATVQASTVTLGDTGAMENTLSADVVGLKIKQNATQTANPFELEDSAGNDQIVYTPNGGAIFNEEGNDADFRVETDTNANALFVDGGNNNVGIGTGTPNVSTILDIVSTSKAFGPPAMTEGQFSLISPRAGMLAYNSTRGALYEAEGTSIKGVGAFAADGIVFINPNDKSWADLNQTTGTFTKDTTYRRLTILTDGDGTADLRGWHTAAPSVPYEVRMYVESSLSDTNGNGFAVGWREAATGELHTVDWFDNTQDTPSFRVGKWTNATTFSTTYIAALLMPIVPKWFKLVDDNTNRIIYDSPDGIVWRLIHTIGRTDFLTADQIFFGAFVSGASTYDTPVSLLSYEVL